MSTRLSIGLATLLGAAVVCLASTPVAAAAPAAAAPVATTSADGSVELLECLRGRRGPDRSALFRGEMRQIPDAVGMRMRFSLHERVGRNPWRAIRAPGLDAWKVARPGVAVFAYRQRIAALAPGTSYRVVVGFQWVDGSGAAVARKLARSPVCRQAGPLASLSVRRLSVGAASAADSARYVATVVNRGRAPAAGVEVSLRVDGAEVEPVVVGRIGPRSKRRVAFDGPPCTGSVAVELDRPQRLRDYDRRDNMRIFGCDGAPLTP